MAAIALGYAMLLFVACLMAGLRWQMIENGTRLVLSEIQVHAPGYYPNRSIQKTFGVEKERMSARCLPPSPLTPGSMPRLPSVRLWIGKRFAWIFGRGGASGGRSRSGTKVTVLNTQIVKGTYLTELPNKVVVGDKLAGVIGVEVGSEIVLLTQAADGSMGNDLYTVGGIFHTGLDVMDRGLVLMPLALYRTFCSCRREGSMKLVLSSTT